MVHPPFAVTVTALPLPDIDVGDTPQPESVNVAVVMPAPGLPSLRVIDNVTFVLPVTVSEKVPELDE